MIKTIEITCYACGKSATKKLTEIKRQQKKGRTKFYCDLNCAGKHGVVHLSVTRHARRCFHYKSRGVVILSNAS